MLHAARGMAAAAELGVMHRDLKPSNMRIAPSGDLKIADFGLASLAATTGRAALHGRPLTALVTALGTLMGTPVLHADAHAAFAEARPLLPSGLSFARRLAALGLDE